MKNVNCYRKNCVIFSFLVGGIIGAGMAVLCASRSGRETRQMIKNFTWEAADHARGYFRNAGEKALSTGERGREFPGQRKSAISAAFEAGEKAYR